MRDALLDSDQLMRIEGYRMDHRRRKGRLETRHDEELWVEVVLCHLGDHACDS